ncbi:MAG TPA: diacylglycerol kinase family protein [Solirubrobacterales bacterium]|nr:diacylglycerol kinase family protein [Solirubrobacterales bacterium]
MTRRRLAAAGALVSGAAAIVLAISLAIRAFPEGIPVSLCLIGAVAAAWAGIVRGGVRRVIGLAVAGLLVAIGISIALSADNDLIGLALAGAIALSATMAQAAFRIHVALPDAPGPERAVLFYNPRSGGGKAERFDLPGEASARGIRSVGLKPGDDLDELVRGAVAAGADGLAMAGGDGSQAIVASVAAEHGLPYACIPAGTRNHFALDLGVDRDDVVGALDAFTHGGERLVDLAEVNGRVFVNNVSLGLYATAVQKDGYREAKLRTLLDTVPEVMGPESEAADLVWTGPHGTTHHSTAAILVSNNRYRLGRPIGSGTRPRIDDGLLGITIVSEPDKHKDRPRPRRLQRPWREWSAASFEVRSQAKVGAGIDGEAVSLEPPLRFRILPGVLRVRVARAHPGASPSAIAPDGPRESAATLLRVALGKPVEAGPGRTGGSA